MKIPRPTTIDTETFGIEPRPYYPPVPVSVSIKKWGKKAKFYSWGHVTGGNNCTLAEGVAAVAEAYKCPDGILFQNGKFDLDVIETHMGIAPPRWDKIHETMFLLFLHDPHQRLIDLKTSAQRLLGWEPEERDAVADWLVENQPVAGVKISRAIRGKEPFGKYIAYAPGTVVGPYANGDTERTEAIFEFLYQKIVEAGMLQAYDRERKLTPILLDMERRGIPVDLPRLRADVGKYNHILAVCDTWIRARLGVGPEVNLDSGIQLINALDAAGLVDLSKLGVTADGRPKSDKAALDAGVNDRVLCGVLKYVTQLKTCLRTFMEPWLAVAEVSGGLIYTNWHQTRGDKGGTRTGRFSSTPNFQNIPKEFEEIFFSAVNPKLPKCPWKDFPPLPLCRSYIIPYAGHVLISRDYSQQEPRILAHFEDGALKQQYIDNPWIDYHDNAKEHLERIYARPFLRKPVKNINLGIIYGQGVPSLAEKNGETVEDTRKLRDSIYGLYPGLRDMYKDMKLRSRTNQPIRTWGGRVYYCEPPKIIKGRIQTFDYKMVNVLVQGSAADCTKDGMISFASQAEYRLEKDRIEKTLEFLWDKGWFLLLQVHDELVISVPEKDLNEAMEYLRVAMESVKFDVQILSEGSYSTENWASMIDYDKKGIIINPVVISQPKRKAGRARV